MAVAVIDDITIAQKAWGHLPNAKHINAVLEDVQRRPEAWGSTQLTVAGTPHNTAWVEAQKAMAPDVWDPLDSTPWVAIVDELRSILHPRSITVSATALSMAESAVIALVAWDNSADLLDCTPDVLLAMIDLAEPPVCHQATLLLPYALVRFGEEIVQ